MFVKYILSVLFCGKKPHKCWMAVGVRFELTEDERPHLFSRQAHSATLAPHHNLTNSFSRFISFRGTTLTSFASQDCRILSTNKRR